MALHSIETLERAPKSIPLSNKIGPLRYVKDVGKLVSSERTQDYYRDSLLECGHTFHIKGQQAIDARKISRRRCPKCVASANS